MRGLVQKPMLGDECMSDGTNPADRNNVLKMLFNEGSGNNKVFDLSGNGNNGSLLGDDISWTSGKFGSCLNMPGTAGDYVDCGSNPSLEVQSHSFVSWVKPTNFTTESIIIAKESIGTDGYEWELDTNGKLRYAYYDGAIRGWYTTSNAISAGIWSQIAGVWDKNAGSVSMYYNGILDSSPATTTGSIIHNSSRVLRIGDREANPGAEMFIGLFDHILLFNRTLSASEIALLCREPFCDLGPRRFLLYAPVAGGISMPLVMQQMNQFNGGMAA